MNWPGDTLERRLLTDVSPGLIVIGVVCALVGAIIFLR